MRNTKLHVSGHVGREDKSLHCMLLAARCASWTDDGTISCKPRAWRVTGLLEPASSHVIALVHLLAC